MRRRILLSASNGYEVVDLGLPSGLLWATCNVGATKETEYGNYYQWGSGAMAYIPGSHYHTGGTDSSYTLPSSADTATRVMGSGWRMPTREEMEELINNTTYSFVTIDGVYGGKFTNKTNPNAYVFFPFAGYHYGSDILGEGTFTFVWSSTASDSFNKAYIFYLTNENKSLTTVVRAYGCPVRGVHAAV